MSEPSGSYFCYRCNRVVAGQVAASGIVCSVCQEGFIVQHQGPPNNPPNIQGAVPSVADLLREFLPGGANAFGGNQPNAQPGPLPGMFTRPPRPSVTIRTHVYRPYNRPQPPEGVRPAFNVRSQTINIIRGGAPPQGRPHIRVQFGNYQPNQQQPQFRPTAPWVPNVRLQTHPTFVPTGSVPSAAAPPTDTDNSQSGEPQVSSDRRDPQSQQNPTSLYPQLDEERQNPPEPNAQEQPNQQQDRIRFEQTTPQGHVMVIEGVDLLDQLLNAVGGANAPQNQNANAQNQSNEGGEQQQQQNQGEGRGTGMRFLDMIRNIIGGQGQQNAQQPQNQQQGEVPNPPPPPGQEQDFANLLGGLGPPNAQIHIEIDGGDINMGDLGGAGNLGELITQLVSRLSGEPVQIGISQEDQNRLPIIKVQQKHVDNETQCVTCMETFKLDEDVVELNCKHIFHKPCLLPWLQGHRTCPICRTEIDPSTWRNEAQNETNRTFVDGDDLD